MSSFDFLGTWLPAFLTGVLFTSIFWVWFYNRRISALKGHIEEVHMAVYENRIVPDPREMDLRTGNVTEDGTPLADIYMRK